MKSSKLRTTIPLVVLFVIGIGFATTSGIGTVSALGWSDISLICPVGALGTMLAAKTVIPRAVVSLAIVIALIVLFGHAFCAWICPVPVVEKLREVFGSKKETVAGKKASATSASPAAETIVAADDASDSDMASDAVPALTAEERSLLKGCSSECAEKRRVLDSRHFVLGGSLLSAAIFGFPVFCLVCPIGLTFATVLLVMRLFGAGDVTWSVIVVPLLLLVEVVFFRKWCHAFCPLGAFMSLVGKFNRTFKPSIDDAVCIETACGHRCGRCAEACPEGINPRHPDLGTSWNECTRCRACVDACPSGALTIPFLPKPSGQGDGGSTGTATVKTAEATGSRSARGA